jgi:TRAP-type C4-dicarboxylate transport system permease small subunit
MFKHLDRVLDALLFVVLAAMATIVAANVFCRFILNFSIYWGDEAAQSLLVWLTFLGAAVAVRDRAHYAFDYLTRYTHGGVKYFFGVFSRVIVLVALLLFLWWSARVAWGIRPWIMPAMGISRAFVYMAGPLGTLLMLIYMVRDTWLFVEERRVASRVVAAA